MRLARLPSPGHSVHRRLRLPGRRTGEDSPLRTDASPRGDFRSRRFDPETARRSDQSVTSRTQSCCASRLAETPFKAEMIRGRVTMTTETAASGGVGLGRGGRLSRQRKPDGVLLLLRGEVRGALPRALGATAATLAAGPHTFGGAGEATPVTRYTDGASL